MKSLIMQATLLATFFIAANACQAQSSDKARQILQQVRTTYAALNSISMTVETQYIETGRRSESKSQFLFRSPNRMMLSTKSAGSTSTSMSDGETFYATDSSQPEAYAAEPMPPQSVGRAALMQYPTSPFLSTLLASVDPFSAPWGAPYHTIALGKGSVLNGVSVHRLEIKLDAKGADTMTYLVGAKDHLLRRARLASKDGFAIIETYPDLKIDPSIPAEKFVFKPPVGARKSEENVYWNKDLKVGSTPPSFETKDLEGNVIGLETMKGKVVLLDFWATWCGPCIQELPHVKAAYKKFHDKGFGIVGISFDKTQDELLTFTKKNQMTWPQVFDGQMFGSEAVKDFQVQGIPFTLLIGKDGKIAAINPRGLFLEPAIENALAKKP